MVQAYRSDPHPAAALRRPPSPAVRERVKGEAQSSALYGRVVARIDRLRQEPFLVIGPKLTDVGIGLDRRVDQLAVLFLAPAEGDVAVERVEMMEKERTRSAVRSS